MFETERYEKPAEQFSLVDIYLSKSYAIKCAYLLDKEATLYNVDDILLNKGAITAMVGSLGLCSSFKYGIKN